MRGGAPAGLKNSRGMRLEGHHADRQAAGVGGGAHVGEQRLMAAVDTVEIADGQCAGRAAFGIGKAAKDSHDSGWVGGWRLNGLMRPMQREAGNRKAFDYKRSQHRTDGRAAAGGGFAGF